MKVLQLLQLLTDATNFGFHKGGFSYHIQRTLKKLQKTYQRNGHTKLVRLDYLSKES